MAQNPEKLDCNYDQNTDQYPIVDLKTEKIISKSLEEIKNGDYDLIDFQKKPNAFLDLYKRTES